MRRRQDLSTETILWLQTTCGNRAVQQLLRRRGLGRTPEPEQAPRRVIWYRSICRWFRILRRTEDVSYPNGRTM